MSRTKRSYKWCNGQDGKGVSRPCMQNGTPGASAKYYVGPGGISCSCCTKGGVAEHKKNQRRRNRRVINQEVKGIVKDPECEKLKVVT